MTWQNSVCMSLGVNKINDINNFIKVHPAPTESAIDKFYSASNAILTKCSPNFIADNGNEISGLMLIGLISATENYFRDVLGYILSVCPSSQAHSAEQKIQLGSLLWGPNSLHSRSAFEFLAFSNSKNISDTFKNFTNHTVKQNGAWKACLAEFDKLCELRHAIVHSGYLIAGKNALKLGLNKNKNCLSVEISYPNLQEAGLVCTALVQSANNELFEMMVDRWAVEWRRIVPSPSAITDDHLIAIRKCFRSIRDKSNKSINNNISDKKFISAVKLAFNL
jgi:hypothetical protein